MFRLAKILALALVIGALAAPSAFGKALQPPVPPEARSAPSSEGASESSDVPALAIAGGVALLLLGAALVPRAIPARAPAHSTR